MQRKLSITDISLFQEKKAQPVTLEIKAERIKLGEQIKDEKEVAKISCFGFELMKYRLYTQPQYYHATMTQPDGQSAPVIVTQLLKEALFYSEAVTKIKKINQHSNTAAHAVPALGVSTEKQWLITSPCESLSSALRAADEEKQPLENSFLCLIFHAVATSIEAFQQHKTDAVQRDYTVNNIFLTGKWKELRARCVKLQKEIGDEITKQTGADAHYSQRSKVWASKLSERFIKQELSELMSEANACIKVGYSTQDVIDRSCRLRQMRGEFSRATDCPDFAKDTAVYQPDIDVWNFGLLVFETLFRLDWRKLKHEDHEKIVRNPAMFHFVNNESSHQDSRLIWINNISPRLIDLVEYLCWSATGARHYDAPAYQGVRISPAFLCHQMKTVVAEVFSNTGKTADLELFFDEAKKEIEQQLEQLKKEKVDAPNRSSFAPI